MRFLLFSTILYSGITSLSILISVGLSSRSHVSGILEISKELANRGHQIHYASATRYLKYAKGFNVTLHELTNYPEKIYEGLLKMCNLRQHMGRAKTSLKLEPEHLDYFYEDHKSNFKFISELLNSESFDVVICDIITIGCRDAANFHKIPMIVGLQTSYFGGLFDLPYMSYNMDEGPLSLEKSSFFERVYDLTVTQIRIRMKQIHFTNIINRSRKELNLPLEYQPFGNLDRNLLLSVSFFGLDPAIHITPNLHLVGPIKSSIVQLLDSELENFIQTKNKIIYIGFGSLSNILPEDSDDIVKGLNLLLDSSIIDGVIWGLGKSVINQTIHPNIKMLKWAPQKLILNKTQTKLFLSHCGIESIFESIDAKTPILCLPLFGDQFTNAVKIDEIGFGLNYPRMKSNPELLFNYVKQIIEDKDQTFHNNVLRLKTISDLQSMDGISQGANLVEKYAYLAKVCRPHQSEHTQIPCEVAHLIPASEKMGFIKSNNLDVYFFLWTISMLCLSSLIYFTHCLIRFILSLHVKVKSE